MLFYLNTKIALHYEPKLLFTQSYVNNELTRFGGINSVRVLPKTAYKAIS
jgi:hypothetical protein